MVDAGSRASQAQTFAVGEACQWWRLGSSRNPISIPYTLNHKRKALPDATKSYQTGRPARARTGRSQTLLRIDRKFITSIPAESEHHASSSNHASSSVFTFVRRSRGIIQQAAPHHRLIIISSDALQPKSNPSTLCIMLILHPSSFIPHLTYCCPLTYSSSCCTFPFISSLNCSSGGPNTFSNTGTNRPVNP